MIFFPCCQVLLIVSVYHEITVNQNQKLNYIISWTKYAGWGKNCLELVQNQSKLSDIKNDEEVNYKSFFTSLPREFFALLSLKNVVTNNAMQSRRGFDKKY